MSKQAIDIFEVGPRDGLQNESRVVSFEDKLWLIQRLLAAGVTEIEGGSFVRGDKVPQMRDSDKLVAAVKRSLAKGSRARVWYLVPNDKGLDRAIQEGVRSIAVFTAASDGFNKKNIGMSVTESLRQYRTVVRRAHEADIEVRGYVSTVFGCPYDGKVAPSAALKVIEALGDMGVAQVSIGDTIGVATPGSVDQIVKPALKVLGRERTALHFHDTRGTALANALRAIELGVTALDSSAGGLGGCPFAPGATGNLATEDLLYMLNGMGLKTGIDLDAVCETSLEFSRRIGRPISSRYLQAHATRKSRPRGRK